MHSLIRAFACGLTILNMSVKLLTEHHLEFLSLKGGCTGSSESTLVKIPHCWKSHDMAHLSLKPLFCLFLSGCLRQVLLYFTNYGWSMLNILYYMHSFIRR